MPGEVTVATGVFPDGVLVVEGLFPEGFLVVCGFEVFTDFLVPVTKVNFAVEVVDVPSIVSAEEV